MFPVSTEDESDDGLGGPGKLRESRAGHDDGFAQCNDDIKRARSAIWPPSTTQSATDDAPYRGARTAPPAKYSIAEAIDHSTSRNWPSTKPPAIQNTADIDSHAVMRMAFSRANARDGGVETQRQIVLPPCIAA